MAVSRQDLERVWGGNDFGPDVEASLDIVGEPAIVVAEDRQFEFERPTEATDITTNDSMLVVRE
ncbi:hypothetical protein [Halomicrococcus sp. NG-SE-24]|uniref:hypothetical protein n=1 Tax=Halomicrococcus sp. NG-SE-24 TaxID=3436928 RepID=UPI003D9821EB